MLTKLIEARDQQLEIWPLACNNYQALGSTERRSFKARALKGALQYNPSRAVSTGAKIDKESIAKRPCFLCESNRPPEQLSEEILPGWNFLVNPFPIFPLHFTIASKDHIPQHRIPVEMVSMAEMLYGMTLFYNGAHAGASAPDHLHCQAVLTSELPLMRYLENNGNLEELPFKVYYNVISPDIDGMLLLNSMLKFKGRDNITGLPDPDLINAYMWIGKDGVLRVCVIPRKAHRPSFYLDADGNGKMVSPGAIDMAGIIVLPRKKDFDSLSEKDIIALYDEVGLPNQINK